eukprot:TRINITY_DN3661_c0_g1_i1.p1 TRINITY_DN3661_c0_g1~~TRINITY_DN3661_c0_g1_i1.p1  ORF type:complete len:111 (-),score=0.32 TRINITY_DN3661_c0_g1_i1:98-430(-)
MVHAIRDLMCILRNNAGVSWGETSPRKFNRSPSQYYSINCVEQLASISMVQNEFDRAEVVEVLQALGHRVEPTNSGIGLGWDSTKRRSKRLSIKKKKTDDREAKLLAAAC